MRACRSTAVNVGVAVLHIVGQRGRRLRVTDHDFFLRILHVGLLHQVDAVSADGLLLERYLVV